MQNCSSNDLHWTITVTATLMNFTLKYPRYYHALDFFDDLLHFIDSRKQCWNHKVMPTSTLLDASVSYMFMWQHYHDDVTTWNVFRISSPYVGNHEALADRLPSQRVSNSALLLSVVVWLYRWPVDSPKMVSNAQLPYFLCSQQDQAVHRAVDLPVI